VTDSTVRVQVGDLPEPTAHYAAPLSGLAPAVRARFLGDNLAGCFARKGDPLPFATVGAA
jgi:hypothetical protein